MKIWVAEGILCDWTCGMAVVCAESEKEAIKSLYKTDGTSFWVLYGSPMCECHKGNPKMPWDQVLFKYHKPTRLPQVFKRVIKPSAYTVSGGG